MTENVIPFGRSLDPDASLTPEELEWVELARSEFQDFLFDEYEAPEIDTANPHRGKRLSPVPHLFSMMLSDGAVLGALTDKGLPKGYTNAERLSYYTLNLLTDFNDISNKVWGTGFVDTNAPEETTRLS